MQQNKYSVHLGNTKIVHNLHQHYWWNGMEMMLFLLSLGVLTCQQVKAEHQQSVGTLQSLPIPEWKWEHITMGFVMGYPAPRISIISFGPLLIDGPSLLIFLAIKMTNAFVKLSWLYIRLIILLHGVLVSIVSDRDPRFVSRFWEFTEGYGYFEFQYCLSPTIRWTIKTHNSDIRRHVESLCFGFQGKLGWPFTRYRICLQQ